MIEKYKREPEEDLLDRTESIKNLSSLVMSTKESLVMSINADWGAGKTTFVKLWQKHLITQGVHSIYFSAWEDDFSKEPLISILGEINNYISTNFPQEETTKKLAIVKDMGSKILRRGAPAVLKSLTGGIIDIKSIEDAIGAMAEQTAKELIERYSQEKEITQKFREAIKTLLEKIDKDKPFVVFIDELDRCRPLYAIELLERVKHIFGIEGLIFILSIDKTQLVESIKSQYGNIDTNNYLRRFIDLEYTLQNPSVDKFCEVLYSKYNLAAILVAKKISRNYENDDLNMLKYLAKSLKLTLREIEQIFIRISIAFKTIQPHTDEAYFKIFVFFATLQLRDSAMYLGLINRKISSEEVKDKVLLKNYEDESMIEVDIEAILEATSKNDIEYAEIIKNKKEQLKQNVTQRLEILISLLEEGRFRGRQYHLNHIIKVVVKKLDFVDRFNLE